MKLVQFHALSPGAGSVGVGLEMLPRARQGALDDYLAGHREEAELLRSVDRGGTWGFDFALYRPIFDFCRERRLPMFARNAPRELVRAVRRQGVEGLSDAQRAELPEGYPWPQPEPHRDYMRQFFGHHAWGIPSFFWPFSARNRT